MNDLDAVDHWCLDSIGLCLQRLRFVPAVWHAALSVEGGLKWDKIESMMAIVASEWYGYLEVEPKSFPEAAGWRGQDAHTNKVSDV